MIRSLLTGAAGLTFAIGSAAAAPDAKAEIDFVTRASMANLTALAEARLAPDMAADPKVKDFARQLLGPHETAEAELRAAAQGSGAPVPANLDAAHAARVTTLQGKSGADFDKAYVADQAEVHSNALTLYADYMLLGDNPKLKALAIKMIPITEAQFKAAQALSRE